MKELEKEKLTVGRRDAEIKQNREQFNQYQKAW